MDKVRRAERKEHEALKGHKVTFLRNRHNLSDKKEKALSEMIELYPMLGEAYRLKVLFNDLWGMPNKTVAKVAEGVTRLKKQKYRPLWPSQKTVKGH